jgi:hypothetical protein
MNVAATRAGPSAVNELNRRPDFLIYQSPMAAGAWRFSLASAKGCASMIVGHLSSDESDGKIDKFEEHRSLSCSRCR